MTSPALQRDPHISSAHKATQPEAKHPKFGNLPLSTSGPQDCALRGTALLATPYFNKGAAFTAEEREEFNLTGLLPQNVQTLDQQVKRAYDQYKTRPDPLAKNTFMTSLAIQNQVLYYRVSTLYLGYQNGFLTAKQICAVLVYKNYNGVERAMHMKVSWYAPILTLPS
jgi:malate dehydrogenase (oxaloacetate-decarboxylating)